MNWVIKKELSQVKIDERGGKYKCSLTNEKLKLLESLVKYLDCLKFVEIAICKYLYYS